MKKMKFWAGAVCLALCVGFASCGDDDEDDDILNDVLESGEDVNPSTVLPEGVPTMIGEDKITLNEKGQVVKVDNGYDVAEFEYGVFSRTDYQVKMTCYDIEDPDDNYVIYMQLNGQGYVKKALQVYSDGDEDTWEFGYNDEGQLNYMKRSEGGDEVTNIYYSGGNINFVEQYDRDGDRSEHVISYTFEVNERLDSLENVCGVMPFDDCFSIDMDEMDMAYYAGLLGKATKSLPVRNTNYADEKCYSEFAWELDGRKFPVSLQVTDVDSVRVQPHDPIVFRW